MIYNRFLLTIVPVLALTFFCIPVDVKESFASRTPATKIFNANCIQSLEAFLHINSNNSQNVYKSVVKRKLSIHYPEVPSLHKLRLVLEPPQKIQKPTKLSAGLSSSELEEARTIGGVFEDYKVLSDLKPLKLSFKQIENLKKEAMKFSKKNTTGNDPLEIRRTYLKYFISHRFSFEKDLISSPRLLKAKWNIHISDPLLNNYHQESFAYVEEYWKNLVRKTPSETEGSIIPLPYEFIVVNATRFDEMYYWDTYFGMKGLLSTHRLDLASKIVENFLYLIRNYGIIPNGNRDYYLSRSQPPFISSMVMDVYKATLKAKPNQVTHTKKWLKERAYPLLKADMLNFWMDPAGRFDKKTGLHHHYDDINVARPERHSADKELATSLSDPHGLGLTYRDTRAAAESGLDFTDNLGKETASTANVLLNSMIYKYLSDLEEIARELNISEDIVLFKKLKREKKDAMNKFLYNDKNGSYQNFVLGSDKKIEGIHAEMFSALYAKVASKEQAAKLVATLYLLEKEGGVMSSLFLDSTHQWDGYNGWAPLHFFIIQGLKNYGYDEDAKRIAIKLSNSYAKIFHVEGAFLERIDVREGTKPIEDGTKYPVQEGFLWTNGVYTWMLTDVLNQKLIPRR